ncbi:RdgB/HAM1 family non-canonical purine NTP pyrophosphatase [Chloroflexota bacterium]
MTNKLLLATNNRGKLREYRMMLGNIPYELVTPAEQGISLEVEEVGETMEENARLKAVAFASAGGLLCLADDSGLEVDALDGEPGVHSARYAGEGASDADRVNFLLERLKGVPWEKRKARFRCVIAIAGTAGIAAICEGECPGIIALEPKGDSGFGYDQVFYLTELDKTMAELSPALKNRVSHRGRAASKAAAVLKRMSVSRK